MENNKMRNIVVLKNLPSNLVEEAIVVLKGNKIKLPEYAEKKAEVKTGSKDYILKEAELIISNYVSNLEKNKLGKKKSLDGIEKKYKRLKLITIGLFIAFAIVTIF